MVKVICNLKKTYSKIEIYFEKVAWDSAFKDK